MEGFELIAHRGASRRAPENTIPALREAIACGVRSVEIDAQLSRDGIAVLFHDRRLRRKTGARGRVRDHDAAFLCALDIGAWFDAQGWSAAGPYSGTPLATLEDALAEAGPQLRYHIELKSDEPALSHAVAGCVERSGLGDCVALTSFSSAQLERAAEHAPQLPRWWLLRSAAWPLPTPGARAARQLGVQLERAAAARMTGVGAPAAAITPALVDAAHGLGLRIRAWGVRDRRDAKAVISSGADGMTTNWPEDALAELA